WEAVFLSAAAALCSAPGVTAALAAGALSSGLVFWLLSFFDSTLFPYGVIGCAPIAASTLSSSAPSQITTSVQPSSAASAATLVPGTQQRQCRCCSQAAPAA